MKPALQLRVNQSLSLTPQLQQAIRLLQLSRPELELELNQALESNPLLELDEPVEDGAADGEEAYDGPAEDGADDDAGEDRDEVPLDLAVDRFDHRGPAPDDESFEPSDAEDEDLRDHLLWQLNLTSMSARDRAVGAAIIEAVDDDGYLTESNESIQLGIAVLHAVSVDEVEAVRHCIQRFDPVGVASRSLAECLGVQLDALDPATPGLALARRLVTDHIEALARQDRTKLRQRLRVEEDDLDTAIALIRTLSPKPGVGYSGGSAEYVAPDAFTRKVAGRWQVALAPGCQPRLGINEHYAGLIAKARSDDAHYLKAQLQEARWLIKSLKTRAETMLKVARAIVRAQEAFLEFGAEAMRPLVLKDVASEIGMHESTVSRVTTRKYLHTPRGTFEFKYFFSSGVATVDGGSASATAIQAMLRKLIDEEAPAQPLSDQALTEELRRRGITVARRTVAKYREAMNIPSSNERSRLG
ncbi:MAG: RNA polymerase factor sigma-54 [Lysobacterales bacterium]